MNPEVEKVFKLEVTQRKLLATFVILGCSYLIACLTDLLGARVDASIPRRLETIYSLSNFCFVGGLIFALMTVQRSLASEFRQGTWDWIKLSSLRPSEIILAKLSAPVVEYGVALFGFAVSFLAFPTLNSAGPGYIEAFPYFLYKFLICSLLFLFCCCVSLLIELDGVRTQANSSQSRAQKGGQGVISLFFWFLILLPILKFVSSLSGYELYINPKSWSFYGISLPETFLIPAVIIYCLIFVYISLLRQMKSELLFKLYPWGIPASLVALLFLFNGFAIQDLQSISVSFLTLIVALNFIVAAAYSWIIVAFFSSFFVPQLRRLLSRWSSQSWRQRLFDLPICLPVLIPTMVIFVLAVCFCLYTSNFLGLFFVFWIAAFLIRDCALVLWLGASLKGAKGSSSSVVLGLAVLYLFVPALVGLAGGESFRIFSPVHVCTFELLDLSLQKTGSILSSTASFYCDSTPKWSELLPAGIMALIFTGLAYARIRAKLKEMQKLG
jgi:hypothetical protein